MNAQTPLIRLPRLLSALFTSAALLVAGCSSDLESGDMRVVFPEVEGLTYSELSSEAQATIRAEVSIEGLVAPTPLEIDPADGSGFARLNLPADASGDYNVKVEYFGARDESTQEVILFRSEYVTTIAAGEVNRDRVTEWVSSDENGIEFDLNRNGISNWGDLHSSSCDPAEVPNPVVVAPMTVSFESGVELGGFTRAFFVIENRSEAEDVHFSLDVNGAAGVTVAPLQQLLKVGSRSMTTLYDSREDINDDGSSNAIAPNGQRVFAVTFAPTGRDFMSGAVALQVETQSCNVRYGDIVRVLGNPDGAVPDSPDDYVVPDASEINIVGYNGEFSVLNSETLFSLAPALVETSEQVGSDAVEGWAIDSQDVDYAYVVAVPANNQFAIILNDHQADLDLILYSLSGDSLGALSVDRDPVMESKNVGRAPESLSFEAGDEPVNLLIAVDRVSPASSSDAKTDGESVATFNASMFSVPTFLPGCSNTAEGCQSPIEASVGCPATYATSFACGGGTTSGTLTLRGKQFQDGAQVMVGENFAICGDISRNEGVASLDCSIPLVDDVDVEGTTVSVSLFNPDGQVATLVDGFTYLPPPPTVSLVTPGSGPLTGGTPITIRGAGFSSLPDAVPVIKFKVGATEFLASDVELRSSQQLQAIVPECVGCDGESNATIEVINPDGQSSGVAANFVYTEPDAPPPTIEGFFPTEGNRLGGTQVTMTGSGFDTEEAVRVLVGGTQASAVNVVNAGSIEFETPPNAPGDAIVQIVNGDNQVATAATTFRYLPPSPEVTSVTPDEAPVSGRINVSIYGRDFTPGSAVAFELVDSGLIFPALNVSVNSENSISCVVPSIGSLAPGIQSADANIIIEDVYGATVVYSAASSGTDAAFTFVDNSEDPPSIAQFSPSFGTVRGNTNVTIVGQNIDNGATVYFDNLTAPIQSYNRDESGEVTITVSTPPRDAGQVLISIRNPDGQEAISTSFYDYQAFRPSITRIDPTTGPLAGGTVMTLTGENFDDGASVVVGSQPCFNTVVINDQLASCQTPPSTEGFTNTVDVYVQNPNDLRSETQSFTYQEPEPDAPTPVISSVSPESGDAIGGYVVTVEGTGFEPTASVYLGGILASTQTQTETLVKLVAPPGEPGTLVQIVIQNADGQRATASFTYLEAPPPEPGAPKIVRVDPEFGPVSGGTLMNVYGEDFDSSSQVTVGSNLCTESVLVSPQLIQCVVPAGSSESTVSVIVTNETVNGLVTSGNQAFTYISDEDLAPVITALEPSSALIGGSVTIAGENFKAGALVFFGPVRATATVTASSITTTVPGASEPGLVLLSVQNPNGQRAAVSFDILPPPEPFEVVYSTPESAAVGTVTRFLLTGTGFTDEILRDLVWVRPASEDGSSSSQVTCGTLTVHSTILATCEATFEAGGDYTLYTQSGSFDEASLGVTVNVLEEADTPLLAGLQHVVNGVGSSASSVPSGDVLRVLGANLGVVSTDDGDIFGGTVYLGSARVTTVLSASISEELESIDIVVPSAYPPGTTVDLLVENQEGLQSANRLPFTFDAPPLDVTSVSPTLLQDGSPTRLFFTGSGFTPDRLSTVNLLINNFDGEVPCSEVAVLAENLATCVATLSGPDTVGLEFVDENDVKTGFEDISISVAEPTSQVFPVVSSILSPRAIGERTVITGSDLGVSNGVFAGQVSFGGQQASSAGIIVVSESELSVVVPSGNAPGATVDVRVVDPNGLQSNGIAFTYGESQVLLSQESSLHSQPVSLEVISLSGVAIASVSYSEIAGEAEELVTRECTSFVTEGSFASCTLPSPIHAGEVSLSITLVDGQTVTKPFLFVAPNVSAIVGSSGAYAGGAQVSFYGQYLDKSKISIVAPNGATFTYAPGDSARLDLSAELVVLTMPSFAVYAASESPIDGGIVTLDIRYDDGLSDESSPLVASHNFVYDALGSPMLVAPSSIPLGRESELLVSIPGVDALQTADLDGNGSLENVALLKTLASGENGDVTASVVASSVVKLGRGLFQMTFPAITELPSSAVVEVVPSGQPFVEGVELGATVSAPVTIFEPEQSFNFDYPVSCSEICLAIDGVEVLADCGGESKFSECVESCEAGYFAQKAILPSTSVAQCWDRMDTYLNCVMSDEDATNDFQCGRSSWEQGLGSNFPDALRGTVRAVPKTGGGCESLYNDWKDAGCRSGYPALVDEDFLTSLTTRAALDLGCNPGPSEIQSGIEFLKRFFPSEPSATFIDNGVVTPVDAATLATCNDVYDDVLSCFDTNPTTFGTCANSNQTIFFNPDNAACEADILRALGVLNPEPGQPDCFPAQTKRDSIDGGEGLAYLSYGIDGIFCLPMDAYAISLGNDESIDPSAIEALQTNYGLVCFAAGSASSGNDAGFTLVDDVRLVDRVDGLGRVMWVAPTVIKVPSGRTLTVDPGVSLKFMSEAGIIVEIGGTLLSQGAPDQPIRMSAFTDPGANANYASWGGILINDAGDVQGGAAVTDVDFGTYGGGTSTGVTSRLAYTIIEHGGGSMTFGSTSTSKGAEAALWLRGVKNPASEDFLTNVQVHNAGGLTLRLDGGDVHLKNLLVTSGVEGPLMQVDQGYQGTISESVFQQYPTIYGSALVSVVNVRGASPVTSLSLENITAVGFDIVGQAQSSTALIDVSGEGRLAVTDSVFHSADGVPVIAADTDTFDAITDDENTSTLWFKGSYAFVGEGSLLDSSVVEGASSSAFTGLSALVDAQGAASAAGFGAPTSFERPTFTFDPSAYASAPAPAVGSYLGAFADTDNATNWAFPWSRPCRSGYCSTTSTSAQESTVTTAWTIGDGIYQNGGFKMGYSTTPIGSLSGLTYANADAASGPFYVNGCDAIETINFDYGTLSSDSGYLLAPVGFESPSYAQSGYALVYRANIDDYLSGIPFSSIEDVKATIQVAAFGLQADLMVNSNKFLTVNAGADAEISYDSLSEDPIQVDLTPYLAGSGDYFYVVVENNTAGVPGLPEGTTVDCTFAKVRLLLRTVYQATSYPILTGDNLANIDAGGAQ